VDNCVIDLILRVLDYIVTISFWSIFYCVGMRICMGFVMCVCVCVCVCGFCNFFFFNKFIHNMLHYRVILHVLVYTLLNNNLSTAVW